MSKDVRLMTFTLDMRPQQGRGGFNLLRVYEVGVALLHQCIVGRGADHSWHQRIKSRDILTWLLYSLHDKRSKDFVTIIEYLELEVRKPKPILKAPFRPTN